MDSATKARAGIIAAQNLRAWGAYAATRFAMKHGALRHFDAAARFERRRALRHEFAGYLA